MKNLNVLTTEKHFTEAYAEHMLDFLYPNFNLVAGKNIAHYGRRNVLKLDKSG